MATHYTGYPTLADTRGIALQTIRIVPLPGESRIVNLFSSPELADAFAITLPSDAPSDINILAHQVLARPPRWFRWLLACRDLMVKPFGIQSSAQMRAKLVADGIPHIDFFPVLAVETNELIVGANDSHLDFRIAILTRHRGETQEKEVVLASVVHCHNRTGKLYIMLIAPFHRLVVRAMLKRAAARSWR
ncbi:DUF2867 domain-containing protein [Klebsiella sp. I138]|uniref:DUF2867 domain-containing protein n=1 Tax=Klebsiella sp. I138 TaxID=2755385 RepID=UPI003DA7BD97